MVTPRPLLELGRGGVGVVHLADGGDGRGLVVQKTLRPELARNVTVRRMFVEEARVASLVRHRAVVAIEAVGADEGGVPWLTMPWTPGVSLQTLSDAAALPVELHVWVLGELLSGLSAVHTALGTDGAPLELVHRDVSPHNVLVTYEGDVKLLDFGIAKARDSAIETTTGAIKGKATYLAPEQLGRRRVDARADLFAVGVMLWQALARRRLWEGLNELQIFDRLSRGEVPPLPADVDATAGVRAVVARALRAAPDERFATATELRDALLAALPPPADARARVRRHLALAFREERAELERRIARCLSAPEASSAPVSKVVDATRTVAPRRRAVAGRWARRATLAAAALGAVALTAARATRARDAGAPPVSAAAAPACVDHDDCADGRLCSAAGACVAPRTARCDVRRPSAGDGAPFPIGVMLPTSGALGAAFGSFSAHAAELAADEINRLAGGVPVGGARRPIALVVCDDSDGERESAVHLAGIAPVIIGFRASDEAISLSREVLLPRGALVLSAMNASPLLGQLDAGEPRRLLRTRSSASSLSPRLVEAVTRLAAGGGAREAGPVRVAILRTGNATGLAFAEQLTRALASRPGVRATEIAASGDGVDHTAVDALAKLSPAIVLSVSDGLFDSVVAPYEEIRKASGGAPPVHLASWVWEGPSFARFIAGEPGRASRFLSLGPSPRAPSVAGLVQRFRERYSDPVTEATVSPAPYDSVYLAAYAAAGAGVARPTGEDLARAISRLSRGPALEVGPARVVEAMRRLSRGDELDLVGVGTTFDFDPATGDASTAEVLLCTTFDAATGTVDAAPASTSSTRPCP